MPGRIRALVDPDIGMGPEVHSNALVVICGGHAEIEAAVHSLHSHDFDMKSVSVIGQEVTDDREVVGCYQIGDSCRYRGPLAAFWESLWELLDGSGFFWMPTLSLILVAGPITGCVVASLESASLFSGLNAVGSAMYSVGIGLDDVVRYERSLKDGRLLLIVHGSVAVVEHARRLLEQSR